MARADLLTNLVRAGTRGDQVLFRRTVEALIAEERTKQHHVLADRLEQYLGSNGHTQGGRLSVLDDRTQSLFYELTPIRQLEDLVLSSDVQQVCQEVVEEHHRSDLLRSFNLEPRHRILLAGPPGNGKTSLAEALATALMVPMLVVRYEGIIACYLGETAVRVKSLFDHVRTRRCVLFLDEFDTLGKERGDIHETGEIKRVVSSLLLQVDAIPSHVVVVTATNHPEFLDRAVWRRFQVRLLLPAPGKAQLVEWLVRFQKRLAFALGHSLDALADKLAGLSFAEVEEFGSDIQRRLVLDQNKSDPSKVVNDRLHQLRTRFSCK